MDLQSNHDPKKEDLDPKGSRSHHNCQNSANIGGKFELDLSIHQPN